jgi:hypothetical protein
MLCHRIRGPLPGTKVLAEEFFYCQCVVLSVKKGSLAQHSMYEHISSAHPLDHDLVYMRFEPRSDQTTGEHGEEQLWRMPRR